MKVNIDQDIKTFNGIKISGNLYPEGMKLKDVCIEALLSQDPNEKTPAAKKIERYELSKKIWKAENSIDLTIEEIGQIKQLTGNVFAPLIVGRAYEMLENKKE